MSIHTFLHAPSILCATDMVCTMPLQLARRFAEAYPLKVVASPVATDYPAFMMWHKGMDQDPGHRWLREYLIETNNRL